MKFVERSGCRIRYDVAGNPDGPVLLFSNSLGTTHALWQPQVDALSSSFRIIRYDTRGHGQSAPTTGPYTIDVLGLDAVAVLDAAGVGCVHVCGLSLGGLTAMWLGVHRRDRVQSLILSSTSARIGNRMMWEERIAQVRASGVTSLADAAMTRWFTAGFRASHPDVVAVYHRMLGDTPAEGYASCCAAIRDADLRDEIGAIDVPVIAIAGHHDPVTPPADADDICRRIRGARVSLLDAAHIANVERAEAFNDLVSGFITQQGRGHG